MADAADTTLVDQSRAWCDLAEAAIRSVEADLEEAVQLARAGVLLRRRWDRTNPDARCRRELVRLLPAVQTIAQNRLATAVRGGDAAATQAAGLVEEQLAEDDRYLVGLLDSQSPDPEAAAFAVECFRDDLHWLDSQVALLDGAGAIDFLGRVLLEQEALERQLDAWESDLAISSKRRRRSEAADVSFVAAMRPAASRLRTIALTRQVDALLDAPDPADWNGWHDRWQAASRLAMRLGAGDGDEPEGMLPHDVIEKVEGLRQRAVGGWETCLPDDIDRRRDILAETADAMTDAATESITFLEDLSLAEAVRSLEIIDEDLDRCLGAVEATESDALKPQRRRLKRRRRILAGELQERRLNWRMERIFGRAFVVGLERFILFLLLLFCAMLVVEGPLLEYEKAHWVRSAAQPAIVRSTLVETFFAWFDLAICMVFLTEFTLKMALAQRRWLYLRRNWLTGLVPSIPVGFFAYAAHNLVLAQRADWFIALRALRYLRLPRMARWLRIARPAIRFARLLGFVLRASDRLVRQLTPLLNRNLVLFERAAVTVDEPRYRVLSSALRERFYYRAAETLHWLPQPVRRNLAQARIDDLAAMLSAPIVAIEASSAPPAGSAKREIPLEWIIARLLSATPAGISDRIGRSLANSVARWCRAFDMLGIRRLPLVRELVSAGRLPSPYETTAVVANRIGVMLNALLDRIHWVADLYGTVTAPQLVDSIGEHMVRGAARPAKRLVLIGLAFWVISYASQFLPLLAGFSATVERLFAWPLIVLGGICLLILALGTWFRRIAGQATGFYCRVADAQFLSATVRLKQRLADRQLGQLHDRVIAPELELAPADGSEWPRAAEDAVELLWEDYLQGAPFHPSDTKTTTQLLGNLALVCVRETRLGYNARRRKQVERLDLENNRVSFRGPYLWFRFISHSLAQQTARLVENYNTYALPLGRAEMAEDREIAGHVYWLSRRLRCGVDKVPLEAGFRRRWEAISSPGDDSNNAHVRPHQRWYQGNEFTAIHFLSADPEIDENVRRCYGDTVADLLRRDRRDNVRRVFRTYPWHNWPKERRTFNPLELYMKHLAGGRVLLLPVKLVWLLAAIVVRAVWLLGRFVRQVLYPSVGDLDLQDDPDPFVVARRKIHRMRKPLLMECLRMRADFDPEYLGIIPPLDDGEIREAPTVQIEEDLARLEAEPGVRRRFREMASLRRRQMADFRDWINTFGLEKVSAEGTRAMAIAYAIDFRGLRRHLEAARRLRHAFDLALAEQPGQTARQSLSPLALWSRIRYARRLKRLFHGIGFADYDASQQAICRKVVTRRRGTLLRDLRRLTPGGRDAADPIRDARETLLAAGRDPRPWSRQLVVLRAVQTLSVLDLHTYCDLVAELGEYRDGLEDDTRIAAVPS